MARLKRSDSQAEKIFAMAASTAFSSMEIIDVPDKPLQPTHLVFPLRTFGQTPNVSIVQENLVQLAQVVACNMIWERMLLFV